MKILMISGALIDVGGEIHIYQALYRMVPPLVEKVVMAVCDDAVEGLDRLCNELAVLYDCVKVVESRQLMLAVPGELYEFLLCRYDDAPRNSSMRYMRVNPEDLRGEVSHG
jgi:hypothetical protein